MRALDLFCGAGGASEGLCLAGYQVTGVDIRPQKNYRYQFIQGDAIEVDLSGYDLIWASPPCQRYMTGGVVRDRAGRPDLIGPIRERLIASGTPWIIENVPGAPLRADVTLCGTQFGRPLKRHRIFEASFPLPGPPAPCDHSRPITGVYGHPHGKAGAWPGMLPSTKEVWSDAMAIDWMTTKELTQAIPPYYSHHLLWENWP